MTEYPFNNNRSPAERRRILRETGVSYRDVALSEADTPRGQYGVISKTYVTGSSPGPQYPSQPAETWSNQIAAIPPEPPLNQDVNVLEPTGTMREVQESLLALGEVSGSEGGGRSLKPTPAQGQQRRRRISSKRRKA